MNFVKDDDVEMESEKPTSTDAESEKPTSPDAEVKIVTKKILV